MPEVGPIAQPEPVTKREGVRKVQKVEHRRRVVQRGDRALAVKVLLQPDAGELAESQCPVSANDLHVVDGNPR